MFILNIFRRSFGSNLQGVSCSSAEAAALNGAKIETPVIQSYFAWRRSVMIFVVLCTALSAGLSTFRSIHEADQKPEILATLEAHLDASFGLALPTASSDEEEAREDDSASTVHETQTNFGLVSETIQVLSWYVLPLAALMVVLFWTKFRFTHSLMATVFAFSFLFPMLLALCPWGWTYSEPHDPSVSIAEKKVEEFAYGIAYGAEYFLTLLPTVLALVPGVQRSCLRVKTLLPQSVLPGWFLVAAAPFYSLVLLVMFVAINQVASGPFFFIGMALLLLAPLIYPLRMDVLTRPLVSSEDYRSFGRVRALVGATTVIAGVCLLVFLMSLDFQGVRVFGLNRNDRQVHVHHGARSRHPDANQLLCLEEHETLHGFKRSWLVRNSNGTNGASRVESLSENDYRGNYYNAVIGAKKFIAAMIAAAGMNMKTSAEYSRLFTNDLDAMASR
jgi:hypothetical protein